MFSVLIDMLSFSSQTRFFPALEACFVSSDLITILFQAALVANSIKTTTIATRDLLRIMFGLLVTMVSLLVRFRSMHVMVIVIRTMNASEA